MKNALKKFNAHKFRLTATRIFTTACSIAMMLCFATMTAWAGSNNAENTAPDGVKTGTMDTLITIIFWILRIFIIVAGGVPATIKIVNGVSDENPRERNSGFVAIGITGVCFAATFAIQALV